MDRTAAAGGSFDIKTDELGIKNDEFDTKTDECDTKTDEFDTKTDEFVSKLAGAEDRRDGRSRGAL